MTGEVLAAYLHPNTVSHTFMDSLWAVADYEREHRGLLYRRFPVRSGPLSIDESRNVAARVFLDQTDCDWLWMTDNDMGFAPDTLSRLADTADPVERPVVAAWYLTLIETGSDGMGGWKTRQQPAMYRWGRIRSTGGMGFVDYPDPPANELVQVEGAGTGCMLIHRSVLEKIRADSGDEWFTCMRYEDGRRITEDLSFCVRLNKIGMSPWVHTGIKATHHNLMWLGQ